MTLKQSKTRNRVCRTRDLQLVFGRVRELGIYLQLLLAPPWCGACMFPTRLQSRPKEVDLPLHGSQPTRPSEILSPLISFDVSSSTSFYDNCRTWKIINSKASINSDFKSTIEEDVQLRERSSLDGGLNIYRDVPNDSTPSQNGTSYLPRRAAAALSKHRFRSLCPTRGDLDNKTLLPSTHSHQRLPNP